MGYPIEMRVKKIHEEIITEKAAKILSNIPYDDAYKKGRFGIYKKGIRKISRNIQLIKMYGLSNRMRMLSRE